MRPLTRLEQRALAPAAREEGRERQGVWTGCGGPARRAVAGWWACARGERGSPEGLHQLEWARAEYQER